jgi:hypothetical protein
LHIPDEEIAIDEVADRMYPRKPGRNQARDKMIVVYDGCPGSRRDREAWNIGRLPGVKNTALRQFNFQEFWRLRKVRLLLDIEANFCGRGMAADEVQKMDCAAVATLAKEFKEANQ